MPALGKARRQARTAQCMSNLRQLGVAYQTYLSSFKNRGFPYSQKYELFWMSVIKPYHGDNAPVRVCPEATAFSGGWGSTFESWGPSGGGFIKDHAGSYAINGWWYQLWPGNTDNGYYFSDEAFNLKHFWRPTVVGAMTSEIPLWFDSSWVDAWPRETDTPPSDWLDGGRNPANSMQRVCIPRHGKAVNVCFFDSHVETVDLARLWQLKWSKGYVPKRGVVVPQ
jgi:prepilin-type processing-associated H-X9-DG protein